jgi:hypothetical protein
MLMGGLMGGVMEKMLGEEREKGAGIRRVTWMGMRESHGSKLGEK